jgi:hypothetical protein
MWNIFLFMDLRAGAAAAAGACARRIEKPRAALMLVEAPIFGGEHG